VISVPYTVINVRTVMVKSLYTKIADVTMSASRSSNKLAFRAHVKRMAIVKKFLKIYFPIPINIPWICERS